VGELIEFKLATMIDDGKLEAVRYIYIGQTDTIPVVL